MPINQPNKIGICGLGLIGGSIAKALKIRSSDYYIVALDNNANNLERAYNDGVIDEYTDQDYSIFVDCSIIFICTPIDNVVGDVRKIREKSNAIITDTASTKQKIMSMIQDNKFIGGHPMAGSEKNGYLASSDILFENAAYALCRNGNIDENDFNLIRNIVNEIGAIPLELSASEHDEAVGIISHLPHLVASSLVNTVADNKNSKLLSQLAAGGFKDITRIASSDESLWKQIIMSSGNYIEKILREYSFKINTLADMIANRDTQSLIKYLSQAKEFRELISDSRKGLLTSQKTLYVEVSDKPGIIGEVATLLGKNGINIKNLYIENNREYEGGSLRITLERTEDSEYASKLLSKNGYNNKAM